MDLLPSWIANNFRYTVASPEADWEIVRDARTATLFLSDVELAFHLIFTQRVRLLGELTGSGMFTPARQYLESIGFSSNRARDIGMIGSHTLAAARDGMPRADWFASMAAMDGMRITLVLGSLPSPNVIPPKTNPERPHVNTNNQNSNEARSPSTQPQTPSKPIPKAPKPASMTNIEARNWYVNNVRSIGQMIDKTKPLEQQARQAFNLRNQFKKDARAAMSDRAMADRLDSGEPSMTWNAAVTKYGGDWQRIIDASMRTNPGVNAEFGIE